MNALVFAGAELYVGFQRPVADGAIVWALGPELPEPLAPARRFELPAPVEPGQEHLSGLDVSTSWILAQSDDTWVLDAAASGPKRRLELPPVAHGKRPRPTGVLMGSVAVILLEDRLGAFALE